MNFLRGQDDFFQTGNQQISVRHLSQPYNKADIFPCWNLLVSWEQAMSIR